MAKEIPLTQGLVALVDNEDFEYVSQFKWCAHKMGNKYYAVRGENKKCAYRQLHRLIVRARRGQTVDHINGDSLDNRRSNLRLCTQAENLRNRSKTRANTTGYKGVSTRGNRFIAQIKKDYQHRYLGIFDSKEEAAKAYDKAALELHGQFAVLNFPKEKRRA